jgi:hypothetical protein
MENEQQITPTSEPRKKRPYKKRLTKSPADKAITSLIVCHRYVKKDIMDALKSKECRPGTNARLAYLKRLEESEAAFTKQMIELGVLPKNVSAETTSSYVFKTVTSKGGGMQTISVSEKQLSELEKSEATQIRIGAAESPEDEQIRTQLENEFGSSVTGGSPVVAVVPDTTLAQPLAKRIKRGPS